MFSQNTKQKGYVFVSSHHNIQNPSNISVQCINWPHQQGFLPNWTISEHYRTVDCDILQYSNWWFTLDILPQWHPPNQHHAYSLLDASIPTSKHLSVRIFCKAKHLTSKKVETISTTRPAIIKKASFLRVPLDSYLFPLLYFILSLHQGCPSPQYYWQLH